MVQYIAYDDPMYLFIYCIERQQTFLIEISEVTFVKMLLLFFFYNPISENQ